MTKGVVYLQNPVGLSTSFPTAVMEEINLNEALNVDNTNKDDEMVGAEDRELVASRSSGNCSSSIIENVRNGVGEHIFTTREGQTSLVEKTGISKDDLLGDRPVPEWVAWREASDPQVDAESANLFLYQNCFNANFVSSDEASTIPPSDALGREALPTSTSVSSESSIAPECSLKTATVPSLFEEDVEFVGVEVEGTEKAMEQALKEVIVGESGPMTRNVPKETEMENQDGSGLEGIHEFNDKNYWKVEQEGSV